MTFAIGLGVLVFAWLTLVLFNYGYINCVEWMAWRLKVHARKVRAMHEKRAALMGDRWVKEMTEVE